MNGFTTLGIVEVASSREDSPANLPELIARRFGHNSLLEWVVRRITDCQQLDRVIVIADAGSADVVRRCVPADVPIRSVSDDDDALGRLAAAIQHETADAAVLVSATTPFVDPAMIDRLVATAQAHSECDYISYRLGDGRPAMHSRIGVLAEVCRCEAIQRADKLAEDTSQRHSATQYICQHPESFQLRFIPVPDELDRDDVRLVIDSEEDWENAHLIYDALGPDGLEWQSIARLLDHQPAIRARMATLNQSATPA